MRLESTDGALVELRPIGYRFPDAPASDEGTDWDANWLVIAGDVRTGDGRSWSFADACLTTWEAGAVAGWLRDVVGGGVRATPGRRGHDEVKVFVEPNLALSLAGQDAGAAAIRFHFALEAGPPWLADDVSRFDYVVTVTAPLADVAAAADAWERELAAYPVR